MSNNALKNSAGGDRKITSKLFDRPYWFAVLVILMGGVWLHGGLSLPQGARYAAVGPGLLVTVAGIGLIICGVILVIQIARGDKFEPQDAEDASGDTPMDRTAFLIAVSAAFFPVIAMEHLGMPITSAISFMLVTLAFGSKNVPMNLLIGIVLTSLTWFGFTSLGLQLGPYLPLLKG